MAGGTDDDPLRQLKRLEREREKLLDGNTQRGLEDPDDPMERLGRRIAAILGPLLALGLIAYLFFAYVS